MDKYLNVSFQQVSVYVVVGFFLSYTLSECLYSNKLLPLHTVTPTCLVCGRAVLLKRELKDFRALSSSQETVPGGWLSPGEVPVLPGLYAPGLYLRGGSWAVKLARRDAVAERWPEMSWVPVGVKWSGFQVGCWLGNPFHMPLWRTGGRRELHPHLLSQVLPCVPYPAPRGPGQEPLSQIPPVSPPPPRKKGRLMLPNGFAICTAPDDVFPGTEPVRRLEGSWLPALFVPALPKPRCLRSFWPAARLRLLGRGPAHDLPRLPAELAPSPCHGAGKPSPLLLPAPSPRRPPVPPSAWETRLRLWNTHPRVMAVPGLQHTSARPPRAGIHPGLPRLAFRGRDAAKRQVASASSILSAEAGGASRCPRRPQS